MYVEMHQMMHRTPDPLPPIRVCIFSLNWSHHMHHCHVLEEKILLTAGLATQSLKLSFID